jgi:Tfp pilus assembly PilM family ATPase
MAKRCIGIDINSTKTHAVQLLVSGKGKFHVEKVFSSSMRRQSDTPTELLKSLTHKHGFNKRANAALALSSSDLYCATIDTEQIDQIDPQNYFPVPPEQIITRTCSTHSSWNHRNTTLMAATTKDSLRQQLDTIKNASLRPVMADAPAMALYEAVITNHPEIASSTALIIYSDNAHIIMVVADNKNILITRNIPQPAANDDKNDDSTERYSNLLREIEMTWRAATNEKIPENTLVVLAGQMSDNQHVQKMLHQELTCRIITFEPFAKINYRDNDKVDPEICIAQGIALRALTHEKNTGFDLSEIAQNKSARQRTPRKEAQLCLYLAIAIGLIYITGLFMRQGYLEKQHDNIKNQIRQIFTQTLPSEKNIVNELVQLEAQLDLQQKQYNLFSSQAGAAVEPLDILQTISANSPKELQITIDEIQISNKAVRISAQCNSSAGVYKWQGILQKAPAFKSVEILNLQSRPDSSSMNFTVSIELKSE